MTTVFHLRVLWVSISGYFFFLLSYLTLLANEAGMLASIPQMTIKTNIGGQGGSYCNG